MNFRHTDVTPARMDADSVSHGGFHPKLAERFRQRMDQIRAAADERDLRRINSLNFEKLKGKRAHEYSIRLDKQVRLIPGIERRPGCRRSPTPGPTASTW